MSICLASTGMTCTWDGIALTGSDLIVDCGESSVDEALASGRCSCLPSTTRWVWRLDRDRGNDLDRDYWGDHEHESDDCSGVTIHNTNCDGTVNIE